MLFSLSHMSKVTELYLKMCYTMIFQEQQTSERVVPFSSFKNISELPVESSCNKVDKAEIQKQSISKCIQYFRVFLSISKFGGSNNFYRSRKTPRPQRLETNKQILA